MTTQAMAMAAIAINKLWYLKIAGEDENIEVIYAKWSAARQVALRSTWRRNIRQTKVGVTTTRSYRHTDF
jgi:hypothetical protein